MKDLLEQALDSHGMQAIITILECICDDKADHLRTNWQDEHSAMAWEDMSQRLTALDTDCPLP